jgi:hypothetical protein
MASESTPNLGLYKPIPGTAEPFSAAEINGNWDILDDAFEPAELGPYTQAVLNVGLTINGGTA